MAAVHVLVCWIHSCSLGLHHVMCMNHDHLIVHLLSTVWSSDAAGFYRVLLFANKQNI